MIDTRLNAKSASIYAVVHRGDKTENLGLISYYHANPLINWLVNLYIRIKGKF